MTVLEAWSYAKPVLMTAECNLPEGFAAEAALRVGPRQEEIATGLRRLSEMSDDDRGQWVHVDAIWSPQNFPGHESVNRCVRFMTGCLVADQDRRA